VRRAGRAVALVAVAALAFVAARTVTDAVAPWTTGDIVADKLAALAERDVGVVFIGSSRTYRGVDPTVFDRTAARLGAGFTSFNLAAPQMFAAEAEFVLEEALADPPPGLRWVVLAPDLISPEQNAPNSANRRTVAWHDLAGTSEALQAVVHAGDSPLGDRLEWSYNHLDSFLINQTGRGRLLDLAVGRLDDGGDPEDPRSLGGDGDGFVSYDQSLEQGTVNRGERQTHEEFLAGEPIWTPPVIEPIGIHFDYVARVEGLAADAGVGVIWLVAPGDVSSPWLQEAAARGLVTRLVDFSDRAAHPDLYDRGLWWNRGHLNRDGARLFSRLLAEALVPIVTGGG